MGRPFIITDDELITLIENYKKEYPKKKIKYADIEAFARANGYSNVKATNIKKRKVITDLIKKLNVDNHENHIIRIMTYSPLDINKLFAEHPSISRLRQILVDREQSLAQLVASATYINEEYKKAHAYIADLKSEVKQLKSKIDSIEIREESLAQKDKEIEYLKDVINTYIYPEMANALLNKDYLTNNIKQSAFEVSTVLPTTQKSIFKNRELDDLLGDLDDIV